MIMYGNMKVLGTKWFIVLYQQLKLKVNWCDVYFDSTQVEKLTSLVFLHGN